MVSVKVVAFAGLTALFTTAASAADFKMPIEMPVVEEFAYGWYLRGDIGFSSQRAKQAIYDFGRLTAPDSVDTISKEFETGGIFGLGIGWQFNHWLRVDLTGEYRSASTFHGFEIVRFGTTTIPEHNTLVKSEWVALLNAYVDLGTWWNVTPFVGAGIGVANVRLRGFTDTVNTVGANNYANEGSKWNFAWALHAGLAYKVTPAFSVELAYRYIYLGDGQTGSPIMGYDGSYQGSHYTLKGIDSHDFKLGVRWMLEPPLERKSIDLPPLMRKG